MSTIYDADYFINKFSKIHDVFWCTQDYTNGLRHCAMGHCGRADGMENEEALALGTLFHNAGLLATKVNDYTSKEFPQPTPKQRIIAALEYIKSKANQ